MDLIGQRHGQGWHAHSCGNQLPLRGGVQLAAVAENILQDMGAVLWPIVRAQFDDALAFAKESLGAAGFQFAWEEGAKWTLEEAVKRALGEG